MSQEAENLYQQAEELFKTRKLDEAAQFYNEAAVRFRNAAHPMRAAQAFAQAAQCERLRTGLEPLLEAAQFSEMAAVEAVKAKNYSFGRWQFREAGILYEREGDFEKYSHCFMQSQHAYVDYLWYIFSTGKKQLRHHDEPVPASFWGRVEALILWLFGKISHVIWGYGEKPGNTLWCVILMVTGCGFLYHLGGPVMANGLARRVDFLEGLYMSAITFSTVGYGDYTPLGWLRGVTIVESLSGFLLVPLLMIGLTRRYLRVYR